MKERGDSLLEQTQKMCQIDLKHVLLMKAKHSTLETKHFVKERRDPLLIMTIQAMSKQCWTRPNMDFWIPGLPHSVVKHAQSTSVRELIQKIENHPDRHALQQDLRQNQAYSPCGPESKKTIQDVDNIELCELLETEPKTQCTACLSYWNMGIVYCTCGHFLQKETAVNRKFVKYTMYLLSLPEYVIKKGRLHGHIYGKSQETNNIICLTNWRRNAKRKSSKESMTDSYEIMSSVFEWWNIIEMKKFVDDLLQMKITLIICQKKNTSTTRTNGGFIQISKVLTPYHWEIVLISSKRCPP